MKEKILPDESNKKSQKKKNKKCNQFKYIIIILCTLKYYYQKYYEEHYIDNFDMLTYFYNVNKYSINFEKKKILLFDYIDSDVCEDINAYTIFQYYQKMNNDNAYYFINENSNLYKSLIEQNKTKNIVPIKDQNDIETLTPYFYEAKIIVQSFASHTIQYYISRIKHIKFLYLTHAVNYFKKNTIAIELKKLVKEKQNIIMTSPYEYNLYKKINLYEEKAMHPAGLPRYDRLVNSTKNESENDCVLISFTFRNYDDSIFEKSYYKKRLEELLSDEDLLNYLDQRNIDLVFTQHHYDVFRGRKLNETLFPKVKFKSQKFLSKYIEQCSLYITDISSVSFDFMFQNKPVLFYYLDIDDPYNFTDKQYMKIDQDNSIYFDNVFETRDKLIDKIKYYVDRNFILDDGLKDKYDNMFFCKVNITQTIVNIISKITNEK